MQKSPQESSDFARLTARLWVRLWRAKLPRPLFIKKRGVVNVGEPFYVELTLNKVIL